jgi:hypothetical protein
MSSYPEHFTAVIAMERIADLHRAARKAQHGAGLPRRHRVRRQRPAWWTRVTGSPQPTAA